MRAYRGLLVSVVALVAGSFPALVAGHGSAAAAATVPSTPRLTVGDVSAVEGDSGKVIVKVPVDLDMKAPTKIKASFVLTGGSATPRTDYSAPKSGIRKGTISINAGRTEGFVSIVILPDTTWEPDDTVNIDVTSAPGANVTRSHGTLTILNDDVQTGSLARSFARTSALATVPRLSVGVPVLWEGNSSIRHAVVPISLSDPAPAPIKVSFTTEGTTTSSTWDSSCHDLNNLTVGPQTKVVSFNTNQQTKYVSLAVHGNWSIDSAMVDVADSISLVSGSAAIPDATSNIAIVDDDTAGGGVTPAPPAPGTYRVSEPFDGSNPTFPPSVANTPNGCGYPSSTTAAVSADGRYVTFMSNADNLVGNDTNGYSDVFVKDTWTGDVERVSVASDGSEAEADSWAESISPDGRYVMYFSFADNLVPGDDNAWYDSFLYDRVTGTVERIGDVHQSHAGTLSASMSADDRYLAFESQAPLNGLCSSCIGVYVLDRTTNALALVSSGSSGPFASAGWAAISGDGQHVAFIGPGPQGDGVYVKDLATGTLELVSVNNAGQLATGVFGSYPTIPALSYDGQVVAFTGQYCNMGLPSFSCGNGTHVYTEEVWVRDRATQTTTIGSVDSNGTPVEWGGQYPSLSADGRYVSFTTDDIALAPECANTPGGGGKHVYVHDRSTGATQRIDVITPAVSCTMDSWQATSQALSADGSYAVFTTMVDATIDVSKTNPEAVYITRLN